MHCEELSNICYSMDTSKVFLEMVSREERSKRHVCFPNIGVL